MAGDDIIFTARELNERAAYATNDELDWLAEWARAHAGAQVVMIGAGPGVMALAMLETDADFSLTVVENDTFQWLIAHAEKAGLLPDDRRRLSMRLGASAAIGERWTWPPLDLLIVDGDHSYTGARADILAWWRHVRSGGVVVFHDYHRTLDDGPTGVREAVEALRGATWEFVADIGISRIYRKTA